MTAKLRAWHKRSFEEAVLFNPAFLGALAAEFVKAFPGGKTIGVPITFIPIALTAALYKGTRDRLPYSTVTSLYEWVLDNEELVIRFPALAESLMPNVKEALRLAMSQRGLIHGKGHYLKLGAALTYTPKPLSETTPEVQDIVSRTRFMGRWLGKSGSETSVLAAWRVRP